MQDFLVWLKGMYEQMGSVYANVDWTDTWSDMDWLLGSYAFKRPDIADFKPDHEISAVVRHSDLRTAKLPLGFRPQFKEIGSEWRLLKNHSNECCVLTCTSTSATSKLKSLFQHADRFGNQSH